MASSVLSGNRNFEGRINPDVQGQLPRLAAAGGGLRPGRLHGHGPHQGAAGHGTATAKPVYLSDIWPTPEGGRGPGGAASTRRCSARTYANVFDGNPTWNAVKVPEGDLFAFREDSTYIQEPPFFTDLTLEVRPPSDIQRRAHPGPPRRLRHHRPHLPRGRHRGEQPGRRVPEVEGRRAQGLQLLRLAARQRPRDGARHLRQHPAQEPDGARVSKAGSPCTSPPAT